MGFYDPDNPLDIYPLDHMVQVWVVFDKPVEVTGRPKLTVEVGSQRRNLDLRSGTKGTRGHIKSQESKRSLNFEYYVRASERGAVVATGIDLNGGTIKAENGEAANLVFENTRLSALFSRPANELSVDGSRRANDWARHCDFVPYNAPQSGTTYRAGEEIQIAASCEVALTVTGTPQVPLIIGARTRYANYVPALSVASQPIFSYTVQKTDFDNNGLQSSMAGLCPGG